MKNWKKWRLFVLEVWVFIYYVSHSLWDSLRRSWFAAWRVIINVLSVIILHVLISKPSLVILSIILILSFARFGSETLEAALPEITERRFIQIPNDTIDIFVQYPPFIAEKDEEYFELIIQNRTNEPIQRIIVSIRSTTGKIIFNDTNMISKLLLFPGESVTKTMPFHVASKIDNPCLTTTILVSVPQKNGKIEPKIFDDNTPRLCLSRWRRYVVIYRQLPQIITVIGAIFGVFAGIFLIFGDIFHPLVQRLRSLLRKQE